MATADRSSPSGPSRRRRFDAAGAPRRPIIPPPSPLRGAHASPRLTAALAALTVAALASPFLAHLYVSRSLRDLHAPARGTNLVLNSGFEASDGGGGAAYWFAEGGGTVTRDASRKHTGAFALRLSSEDGATVTAGAALALVPLSDRVHIEAQACARGLRGRAFVRLVFFAADGSGPLAEPETSWLSGTSDWRPLRASARVPAGAGSAILEVVLEGRGTVWFDNVRALSEEAWDPGGPAAAARPGPFRNGSFEDVIGGGVPRFWVLAEEAGLDASVRRTGECSLRAAPRTEQDSAVLARQDYHPPERAGSRTAAQVHVCSPRGADARLVISCFDRAGRLMAVHADEGRVRGGEWQRLFVDFAVPEGCGRLRMTLSAAGGECWFDDAAVR